MANSNPANPTRNPFLHLSAVPFDLPVDSGQGSRAAPASPHTRQPPMLQEDCENLLLWGLLQGELGLGVDLVPFI